jgi:hypothetical protein
MKIKILLIGVAITAFIFTTFAASALLSPRAWGNQAKDVKSVASDSNPSMACCGGMAGSPTAVTGCSQHMTMPGCQMVAPVK